MQRQRDGQRQTDRQTAERQAERVSQMGIDTWADSTQSGDGGGGG